MPDQDVGAAINEGLTNANALTGRVRANLAYNALTSAFGPGIAGDPKAWGEAVSAETAQQEAPLKIAAEKAELAGTQALTDQYGPEAGNPQAMDAVTKASGEQADQTRLAAYRATQMLKNSADPTTGAVKPADFDKLVGANASLLGLDPAHIQPLKDALTAPGGAAHLDTMAQALLGPVKMSGAPIVSQMPGGGYGLTQRDQYGNPVIQALPTGVTPVAANVQQQRAAQGAQRVNIAGENAATARYRAGVYGANQTYAPEGGPPAGGGGGVTTNLIGAKGGPGEPAPAATPYFDHLPPKGRQAAIGQAQSLLNQESNLKTVNTILDQVDSQISPYTAGTGSLLKDLPGSAQANLKANLGTLSAQGLTTWIQSLKNAQGQTGLGRVLQTEANAAMKLYGNMEQDQSAKQLAFHATLFRQAVNSMFQHAQAGFKTMYGADPATALGLKVPAPGSYTPQQMSVLKKYGL